MTAIIPSSTYRLQFNRHFTFQHAIQLIPYLSQLGITHCYASPLLAARAGSTHGYDIVDHNRFNPEIGTEAEFDALVATLKAHDMGLIIDIVPNHMGIGEDNAWWTDVLENGAASRYASYFDIDWSSLKPELAGKVLLPVLGQPYGIVLEQGDLQVRFLPTAGAFTIHYFDSYWPVAPQSYPIILRHHLDALEKKLNPQPLPMAMVADGATEALPSSLPAAPDTHNFSMAYLEYESILRAFEQLPLHTERDTQRNLERDREVMVAKHRLAALYQKSADIRSFLATTLDDFNDTRNNPGCQDLLHQLLEAQVYRLAYWRVAGEEVNYRRFFDINTLAGVCVEHPEVFRDTHTLILRLIQQGKIQGVRIDHPDGLFDPAQYFQRLQVEAAHALTAETSDIKPEADLKHLPFYVLAEKILAPFEHLPGEWAIHGTTGYDFIHSVNGLFVQPDAQRRLTRIYRHFTGINESFADGLMTCKRLTLKVSLASELNVLAHQLNRLSESDRRYRDFTLNGLRRALAEVITAFPVYRTYLDLNHTSGKDKEYVMWAIGVAKKRSTGVDLAIFDFIQSLLLADLAWFRPSPHTADTNSLQELALIPPHGAEDINLTAPIHASADPIMVEFGAAVRRFAMKFQQLSGPVMAKSMEDTAFYRYNRLISLNEVGSQPDVFGLSIAAFHRHNQERARHWPHAMLASSTHDTKRSEDVRARLNVLSEIPRQWYAALIRWRRMNDMHKTVVDGERYPSGNDEYMLYQTLLGVFPVDVADWSVPEIATDLKARLKEAMQKAVREAKVHTSWINPNDGYENALFQFIDGLLDPRSKSTFQSEFTTMLQTVAAAGFINTLSQLVLKLTCPGVPDIYQGMELPTFSMVDPDNRRAVDYDKRHQLLTLLEPALTSDTAETRAQQLEPLFSAATIDEWLKLFITTTTLRLRKTLTNVFSLGSYIPVTVEGDQADHVVAFIRSHGDCSILVVVSRFWAAYLDTTDVASLNEVLTTRPWHATELSLPESEAFPCRRWKELYTCIELTLSHRPTAVSALLPKFPVAIWVAQ